MELLGELERGFANVLYPWRWAIGAGLLALAAVVVLVGRRRRWDQAARRHPRRLLALGLAIATFGVPVGWYLGSPLFIRTELNEPAPVVAAQGTSSPAPAVSPDPLPVAASASPTATIAAVPGTPSPEPSPTASPFTPRTIATGQFKGADSFHFGRGSAALIETDAGAVSLRFESFSVRNGPDLFVYLSPSAKGYTSTAVELGRLKATDGAFNYVLPAGLDLSAAKSVIIWCKQFATLFAVAPLAAA